MPTRANQLELAWAAGFIDGEGYIGTSDCTRKTDKSGVRRFSAVVDVSQVKPEPIYKLQQLLGGNVRAFNTAYGVHHTWRLYGDNTIAALRLVIPYLVNKRRQAELVIEFQSTKRKWIGERIPQELHIRREAIHHELRMLNAKRNRLDAERLSEEAPSAPSVDDAIVRSRGNKNHVKSAEMTDSVQ